MKQTKKGSRWNPFFVCSVPGGVFRQTVAFEVNKKRITEDLERGRSQKCGKIFRFGRTYQKNTVPSAEGTVMIRSRDQNASWIT